MFERTSTAFLAAAVFALTCLGCAPDGGGSPEVGRDTSVGRDAVGEQCVSHDVVVDNGVQMEVQDESGETDVVYPADLFEANVDTIPDVLLDAPKDACVPSCESKECGTDGCGGVCGSCSAPQDECMEGTCLCLPSCDGKECGDDGCGSACGECAEHFACDVGMCLFQPACGDGFCAPELLEECSSCPVDCGCECGKMCQQGTCSFTACVGKECGPDGCGGLCGACPGTQYQCMQGACVCQADCSGRECGEDGCGGTCGECMTYYACNLGQCEYQAFCGNGTCDEWSQENCTTCPADCPCNCGETCGAGACFATACAGKECGEDGCGGVCGECLGANCAGLVWTSPSTCLSGHCQIGVAYSCDDQIPCTFDSCNPILGCDNLLLPGYCLVESTCWAPHTGPSKCLTCEPSYNLNSLYANIGGSCDDGAECTLDDVCLDNNGTTPICLGLAYSCDDELLCTVDECDGLGGCSHTVLDGYCAIDGECLVEGAVSSSTKCKVCKSTVSKTAWTNESTGTECLPASCHMGEGSRYVQMPAKCIGGKCVSTYILDCDDGNGCTDDVCLSGECTYSNKTNGSYCMPASNETWCQDGVCECKPVCEWPQECGNDGCGGSCGTCPAPLGCGPSGICHCPATGTLAASCVAGTSCCSGSCVGGTCTCRGTGAPCDYHGQCCGQQCSDGQCMCSYSICMQNSDCCSGICTSGSCLSCLPKGAACSGAGCCSLNCKNGYCGCAHGGVGCSIGSDCCSGICTKGKCQCGGAGASCMIADDCCSKSCVGGKCGCVAKSGSCSNDWDCCSGVCEAGQCGCGVSNVDCLAAADCCAGSCVAGKCGTCIASGGYCGGTAPCCHGACLAGYCCEGLTGSQCGNDADCCSGLCNGGYCECRSPGTPCIGDAQCCGGCRNGACCEGEIDSGCESGVPCCEGACWRHHLSTDINQFISECTIPGQTPVGGYCEYTDWDGAHTCQTLACAYFHRCVCLQPGEPCEDSVNCCGEALCVEGTCQ